MRMGQGDEWGYSVGRTMKFRLSHRLALAIGF